jgi:hypothetical protein
MAARHKPENATQRFCEFLVAGTFIPMKPHGQYNVSIKLDFYAHTLFSAETKNNKSYNFI